MAAKDKYLQIFKYLKKFSELRSQTVRDMENSQNYQKILWLDELPEASEISHILDNPERHDAVSFLEVFKPKEVNAPRFHIDHEIDPEWINVESLLDENTGPQLKESRIINEEINYSSDSEELSNQLNDYTLTTWKSDLLAYRDAEERHESYLEVSSIFQDVFSIHNKVKQFSEEFEAVFAIGQLTMNVGESSRINRTILAQPVNIEFEFSNRTKLIVLPTENDRINVELDAIIDLEDIFNINTLYQAEKTLKHELEQLESNTALFDEQIHVILQKFIDSIHHESSYQKSSRKSKEYNEKPRLRFAPCLIFRKRTAQRLTAVYEKIIEQIRELSTEDTIPSLGPFIGAESASSQERNTNSGKLEEVYFPLPFNDEQHEIAYKASINDKVLVQGPPGTGKSHTIANLISNLLAKGKKVLVTAQTKRALEVLHEKLPEEIRKIVVNLLSSDSDSVNQLKSSVNHIISELGARNLNQLKKDVNDNQESLDITRQGIAKNKNELTKLKEEISSPKKYNSQYHGNPTEVASELHDNKGAFEWYKDSFNDLSYQDLLTNYDKLLEKLAFYNTQDTTEFHQEILNIKDFPSLETVEFYFDIDPNEQGKPIYKHEGLSSEELTDLTQKLKESIKLIERIDDLDVPNKENLISQYKNLRGQRFKDKIDRCLYILNSYKSEELRNKDRDLEVEIKSQKSLKVIKNDAFYLWEYVKKGGKLQGAVFSLKKAFLNQEVKEKLYLIDEVLINGSPCDTREELENLINYIDTIQDFEEVNQFIQIDLNPIKGLSTQFEEFSRIISEVETLFELLQIETSKRKSINSSLEEKIQALDSSKAKEVVKELQRKKFEKDANKIKKAIGSIISRIKDQNNPHSLSIQIVKALDENNYFKYAELLALYDDLIQRHQAYQAHILLMDDLREIIPNTINLCIQQTNAPTKEALEKAILFSNAHFQLTNDVKERTLSNLNEELYKLEDQELKLIEELASSKAWVELQKRLEENSSLKQHLQAWALAVSKIGKTGRGQRAQKWKKEAQKEMEHCKDAIPCWIMPLFKVAETINPEPEIFDYVIIDEASQLGPDAIFLSYIAKNIIIVGDDKQTSPEYVGIAANSMEPHINRYLDGIPFKNYYGMEFSFFDHASLFCDGVTVLKEHFRCMPEIIEFSNKHFYAPEGKSLYPLRQYSANRLRPLENRYCDTGNVIGKGSNIINKPEANMLVNILERLIEDEAYDGKSFGVICMQGHQQARHIEALLLNRIGAEEYAKRRLVCGNSTSFQGDERDVMFLSLVTAPNHNARSLTSANDQRRFNVAMSRAKDQVWLFHSVKSSELSNTEDLRYKLIQHFTDEYAIPDEHSELDTSGPIPPRDQFDSDFEVEVYKELVKREYKVTPQYSIAGGRFRIDLVVSLKNGKRIGIECDGDEWHGPDRYESDMMRQKVLERSGWTILRLRGSEFYCDKDVALEPIFQTLNEHDSEIKQEVSKGFVIKSTSKTGMTHHKKTEEKLVDQTDHEPDIQEPEKEETNKEFIDEDTEFILPIESSKDTPNSWITIFENGNYVINDHEFTSTKNHITIPISGEKEKGFLLQCYESGHINKINVSFFMSKSKGKVYSNGLFGGGILQKIIICQEECMIGMRYVKVTNELFKAHKTTDISFHTTPHLKGNKVISSEIKTIEFFPIDLKWEQNISKLLFSSFTANGKWVDNTYYQKEWDFIKRMKLLGTFHGAMNEEFTWKIEQELETIVQPIVSGNTLKLGKIVTVHFHKLNQTRKLKIVKDKALTTAIKGVDIIGYKSPLAQAILGKSTGSKVVIGSTENLVEILEVK